MRKARKKYGVKGAVKVAKRALRKRGAKLPAKKKKPLAPRRP